MYRKVIRKYCFTEGPAPDTLDETLPTKNAVREYCKLQINYIEQGWITNSLASEHYSSGFVLKLFNKT